MSKYSISIGPENPAFGSWDWIGMDLLEDLQESWRTQSFQDVTSPPLADIILFLKFKPSDGQLRELRKTSHLVYMPVDIYGSVAEIESDRESLRLFDLVLVHCQRLIRYLAGTVRTEYVDHTLKYVTPEPLEARTGGALLWVGRQCNIRPVVNWCNGIDLDRELWVLTESADTTLSPDSLKFTDRNVIRVSEWNKDRHVLWTQCAFAAIDLKSDDFRARHKPPAKTLDFLASGLPVVINRGGSTDLHLQSRGIMPFYTEDFPGNSNQLVTSATSGIAHQLRYELARERVIGRHHDLLQSLVPGRR